MLELLVNASLMLQPVDIDALRYVWKTAKLLQVPAPGLHACSHKSFLLIS